MDFMVRMGNYGFPSIRSYSLIKILHPTLEFESPYDKGDLLQEGRGKGEHCCLSLEQNDGQERTH